MRRRNAAKLRIGLWGFHWTSLSSIERSRYFYLSALEERYELFPLEMGTASSEIASLKLELIVSFFYHQRLLFLSEAIAPPIVYIWHAGSIQRYAEIKEIKKRLRAVDTIIVNCTSDERILKRQYGERAKIALLPLPASPVFRPAGSRSWSRKHLSLPAPDFIVGFVGRMFPQKNPDRVLDLLDYLVRRHPDKSIRGFFVGNFIEGSYPCRFNKGNYRKYFLKKAERLNLLPHLTLFEDADSDNDIALCYQSMNMLYHPTNVVDENFGYTVVEAQATKLPIVAAALGGLKDTIVHRKTGLLFNTWMSQGGIRMDWPSAHRLAEKLLLNTELREELGENAKKSVERRYRYGPLKKRLYKIIEGREKKVEAVRSSRALPKAIATPASGMLDEADADNPRWRGMQPYIYEYMSAQNPEITPRSKVFLSAPLAKKGAEYVLKDFCWPASYKLDPNEVELIRSLPHDGVVAVDRIETKLKKAQLLKKLAKLHKKGIIGATAD